jgi:acid stress-induced BolA-like protein IbaG/YrbA
MDNEQVKALIEAGMPGARVEMIGDACNMAVLVVSDDFEGKSLIQRHRMVMETVKAHIASNELHALSIKAKTEAEAAAE